MPVVKVNLPDKQYDVVIEQGALNRSGPAITKSVDFKKAIVFADQNVADLYGRNISASLTSQKKNIFLKAFDSGEDKKNIETVSDLYTSSLEMEMERSDLMIALGGGVAGDLVGFVAATYQRGVPFIQVPTSLLAMVDASVGGKTGYNHPLGKNMIGAFHQPELVLIDTDVLKTLPEREFRCGLAECIKHALITDWSLFEWMEHNIENILSLEADALSELIASNVTIKADIVEQDEKEAGRRALLNFGHTFGHAIEVTSGYGTYKHGEAVALGCIAACHLSEDQGLCPEGLANRVINLTKKSGLPVKGELATDHKLMEAMARDKKVQSGTIRLILPTGQGAADIFNDIDHTAILSAWQKIRT